MLSALVCVFLGPSPWTALRTPYLPLRFAFIISKGPRKALANFFPATN